MATYDNVEFFNNYKSLRNNKNSPNKLVEKPEMYSLLGSVCGKNILDLGCGFGEDCARFANLGANHVIGVDNSIRMLKKAYADNETARVHYLLGDIEEITSIYPDTQFDIVYSSLAVHYVENFDILVKQVHKRLCKNGIFVFSQEHPLSTAVRGSDYWNKTQLGGYNYYKLDSYMDIGERERMWLGADIKKYHRTFSEILNTLIVNGFRLEVISEPVPQDIQNTKYMHKPDFLIIKAVKI